MSTRQRESKGLNREATPATTNEKQQKTEKAYEYAKEFVTLNPESIRSKQIKKWFIENGYPVPNENTDIDNEFRPTSSFISILQNAIKGSGDNKFLSTSSAIPSIKEIVYNSVGIAGEKKANNTLIKLGAGFALNRINYSRILGEQLLKLSQKQNGCIINVSLGCSITDRDENISTFSDFIYNIKYTKIKQKEEKALLRDHKGKKNLENMIRQRVRDRVYSSIDNNGFIIERLRDDCYLVIIENRQTDSYVRLSNGRSKGIAYYNTFIIGDKNIVNIVEQKLETYIELKNVSSDKGSIMVYTVKSKTVIEDEKAENENMNPYHKDPFLNNSINPYNKNNRNKTSKMLLDNTVCSETKAKSFDQLFIEGKEDLVTFLEEWKGLSNLYEEYNLPHKLGVFLHGDPGTGKTSIAKAACKLLNKALLVGDMDNLDRTISIITSIENIEDYVILFEDVDLIIGDKAKDNEDIRQTKVNKLLQLLDGTTSRNTLIFATTNDIESLPENFLRKGRFDVNLEIGNLSYEYAERLCKSYDVEANKELLDKCIHYTKEGTVKYNPSELQSACIEEIIREKESRLKGKDKLSSK